MKRKLLIFALVGFATILVPTTSFALVWADFNKRLDEFKRCKCGFAITAIDTAHLGDPKGKPLYAAQLSDTGRFGRIFEETPEIGALNSTPAASTCYWRVTMKGLQVLGKTAGGAAAGVVIGTFLLFSPLGIVIAAVIIGGATLYVSVEEAIELNENLERSTQDLMIYDEISVLTSSGDFDLSVAIISAILSDPGRTRTILPGGGALFLPGSSLFAGSKIVDALGVTLPDGEVGVGVIDADGDLGTSSDQAVVVICQNLSGGIQLTDDVMVNLDNVVPPGTFENGDLVRSNHAFVQTFYVQRVPALTTYGLIVLGLLVAGTAVWMVRKRMATKGGLA